MKRTALDNRNKDETESNGSKPRALQRTSNGRMLILSLQGTPRLHIPNPLWFWRFTIRWSSFMHLTAASASALPLARQEAQLRRLKINLASGFLICPCSSFSHGALTRVATRLSPVSTKSRLCHKLSDNIIPATLVVRLLSTPGELYTLIIVYINYDTLPERDFHSRLPLLASLALYPFTHATTYDVLPLVHSNTLGFNSPLGARGYKCQVPL